MCLILVIGSPKGAAGGPPMFLGFDSDHFDDLSPSYSPMSKDSLEGSPKKQQPLDLDYLYQPGTSTSSAKAVNDNVAPCFANFGTFFLRKSNVQVFECYR